MQDIQAAIEAATFTQLDDIARTVWGLSLIHISEPTRPY